MLSDASSNIVKEAHVLGVKVTSEKTFLTFDKENKSKIEGFPSAGSMGRRRFTTTDIVMDKELLEKVRALETVDASPMNCIIAEQDDSNHSGHSHEESPMEELRRASLCSQDTLDFDLSPLNPSRSVQYCSILVHTPQLAAASMSPMSGNAEGFTTVMVRNIPNRYNQDSLIDMLKSMGFRFNFFYCPIDRNSRANCGYFFINLLSPEIAVELLHRFQGLQLPAFRSSKVCSGCWARIQGYSANVDHYLNSPLSRLNREFRPRVFDVDGNEVSLTSFNGEGKDASQCKKLFVGGLSPETTAERIKEHMSQFGPVDDVSIILDSASRSSRGFCFVTFRYPESARLCVATKQAHFIDGRSLGIRPYTKS